MTDIFIRGVDGKTLNRLKSKAKRNGRSLQGELLDILEQAAGNSIAESIAAGKSWRTKLGRKFGDSTAILRKERKR
jgi:hypothetical protein